MTTKNDITGDLIYHVPTDEFRKGYEKINWGVRNGTSTNNKSNKSNRDRANPTRKPTDK